jgi:hypothetical protein
VLEGGCSDAGHTEDRSLSRAAANEDQLLGSGPREISGHCITFQASVKEVEEDAVVVCIILAVNFESRRRYHSCLSSRHDAKGATPLATLPGHGRRSSNLEGRDKVRGHDRQTELHEGSFVCRILGVSLRMNFMDLVDQCSYNLAIWPAAWTIDLVSILPSEPKSSIARMLKM